MIRNARILALLVSLCSSAAVAQTSSDLRVGLALSGGGARGFAHVGVLKRFEESSIPIHLIAGTSFGSLVGGLYSVGYSATDIEHIVQQVDWNKVFDSSPERRLLSYVNKQRQSLGLFEIGVEDLEFRLPKGLTPGQKVSQLLERLVTFRTFDFDNDFDQFAIPFRAVATDLVTGSPHIFRSGSLGTAIRASIAVPGVFTPVEVSDALLVDGGLAMNLPTQVVRDEGADLILAVDVTTPSRKHKDDIKSVVDVLDQVIGFHIEENLAGSRQLADLIVRPDLGTLTSSDFPKSAEFIELGYQAADAAMPEILALLSSHGLARTRPMPVNQVDPATFDIDRVQPQGTQITPSRVEFDGVGETPTDDRVLATESLQGDEIERNVSRLFAKGRYDEAGFRLEREAGGPVLVYELKESARSHLGFGFRYDLDYQFTGAIDLRARDFPFPRTSLNVRALVGNVLGVDGDLLWRPVDRFRLTAGGAYLNQPKFFFGDELRLDYDDRRSSLDLRAAFETSQSSLLDFGYRLEAVDARFGGDSVQTVRLGSLDLGFGLDSRDRSFFARAGVLTEVRLKWQDQRLGGELDYLKWSASTQFNVSVSRRGTLQLDGNWGLLTKEVPFYQSLFSGGPGYMSFSAHRFLGLERDQIRSRQRVIVGAGYRHRLREFQLGFIRQLLLSANYNAGLFSSEVDATQFRSLLHGYGAGLLVDTSLIGPIQLMFTGTNDKDFTVYFSLGHRF